MDNIIRNYGHITTDDDKSQRFKSDFTFEELTPGFEVLNVGANTKSTIMSKTTNSIEVYNRTNPKNRWSTGARDSDGELMENGKLKGINSKNWYLLEDFNRTFRRIKK